MEAAEEQRYRDLAKEGKYAPLYRYLTRHPGPEWSTSFGRIEEILRCKLPEAARCEADWWANRALDASHDHALAWRVAGWRVRAFCVETETLIFELDPERERAPRIPISFKDWPVWSSGPWPEGLTVSREQIYEDRI